MKIKTILKFVVTLSVSLLLAMGWLHSIAPEIKKLPDNFTYSANILSLDNFYDETLKKFEGRHISKTLFTYKVVSVTPNYDEIDNTFTVSKLSNKPIFSVSRQYFINPYTKQHVTVPGQEKRQGYLFAPSYASKQPFYYWHVNYDAPALMHYVNTVKLDGLTVYHYQANYIADQTMNLTNLPGVPEKRGIRTHIRLQLWIEPISGWLVKYQDNTLANYYDRATGIEIAPWNHFSNRYTQNSINEKAQEAFWLKWKYLFADYGAPLLIIILPQCYLCLTLLRQNKRFMSSRVLRFYVAYRNAVALFMVFALFIASSIGTIYYIFYYKTERETFLIGISQWNNNSELSAAVQGFKDGLAKHGYLEGQNIKFISKSPNSDVVKAIGIMQSFVRDNVNLIFTLTTPGVLVAKGVTHTIPIVFTDVSYPIESGIISLDPNIQTNITGTSNYIAPAEQFYRFDVMYPNTKVLGFVHHKGDPDSEIQYQQYKSMLARRSISVLDIPAIDFEDMQNKLQSQQYDALFVACDTLIRDGGGKVAASFAKEHKIPSFTCDKDSVMEGVLLGYFADLYALGQLAGVKAAMILQGADPSWLHTELLSEGDLVINKKTANLLNLTIPLADLEDAKLIDQ